MLGRSAQRRPDGSTTLARLRPVSQTGRTIHLRARKPVSEGESYREAGLRLALSDHVVRFQRAVGVRIDFDLNGRMSNPKSFVKLAGQAHEHLVARVATRHDTMAG